MPQSTGMLSPEERERRARAYEEQARRLREAEFSYEFGEVSPHADKKSKSVSKAIINGSFIVFGLMGVVGSFWDAFDMEKYVSFLQTFAWVWAPLVIAVGGGRAFKNFVNRKYSDPSQLPPNA